MIIDQNWKPQRIWHVHPSTFNVLGANSWNADVVVKYPEYRKLFRENLSLDREKRINYGIKDNRKRSCDKLDLQTTVASLASQLSSQTFPQSKLVQYLEEQIGKFEIWLIVRLLSSKVLRKKNGRTGLPSTKTLPSITAPPSSTGPPSSSISPGHQVSRVFFKLWQTWQIWQVW